MEQQNETLVKRATAGDKSALEALVLQIQDVVYRLALRMLYLPQDAEDATQEVLVKVITHLGSFRMESSFKTWVYRIAANHLITVKKSRMEQKEMSFDSFEQQVETGLAAAGETQNLNAEQALMARDIMLSCTHGLLMCLSRDHRIAFILGEISELDGKDCAYILAVSPEAFRKRRSRARVLLKDFMSKTCGLVNPDSPCRCERFVNTDKKTGEGKLDKMMFAGHPSRGRKGSVLVEQLRELDELQRIIVLYRSHPDYAAPEVFVEQIRGLVDSGRFHMFRA